MTIVWKGSPNFWKDRVLSGKKYSVKKIVIHWFGAGTLENANARFQKASEQASAHYGVSKGRVWQWVKEKDAAWHAGNGVVNLESIGIEHDATPDHKLTDQDYFLSGQLVAQISKTYNVPLDRAHVIGHREVKATQCPGSVDIDRIIAIAKSLNFPTPMPENFVEKCLVLFDFVPAAAQDTIKVGIGNWLAKVAARTTEFKYELTYGETAFQFHTVSTPDPMYGAVVYPNPSEVIIEAHKKELELGKEFNAVCLFYDDRKVIGPPPNHPIDPAIYAEGFNAYSIPLSWVSNINDPSATQLVIYPDSVEQFFSHEGSHQKFFVVNYLKQLGLRDKTHDWEAGINPNNYPSPIYQYLDYLLELKPYWDVLTSGSLGVSMISFEFAGTIYVQVFTKFVGIADQDTFVELGGNANSIIHLNQEKFDTVIKPFLAKSTILK